MMVAPLLVALLACALGGVATPVRYDQRQDGDTNIDGKLENIAIVLVGDDFAVGLDDALNFVPEILKKNQVLSKMALPPDASSTELVKQTTSTEVTPPSLNQTESGSKKE